MTSTSKYDLEFLEGVEKALKKMQRSAPDRFRKIRKRILHMQAHPARSYKFLRAPLQGLNRVHVDSDFVLLFFLDHEERTIVICHVAHHKEVYKWRPES